MKHLFEKGNVPWNKGLKNHLSVETSEKMRTAKLGKKRFPNSEITKQKQSEALKGEKHFFFGKHHTEETKRKISKAILKKHLEFGLSEKELERGGIISKVKKGKAPFKGKNHPNWRGGISLEEYGYDWTETLKRSIRERDKYTCRLCSKQQTVKTFDIHHIDYNKKNNDPINLITLCKSCHTKTNYKRNYWKSFLENLCLIV